MKILYKKVLNLELWHDYCLGQLDLSAALPNNYNISTIVTVVPTIDCQQVLKNLHWVFRSQPWGGSLYAEVEAATGSQPPRFYSKIPITWPSQLIFWLIVRDPRFANFTNLPFTAIRDRVYYFSNQSGTIQGQTLFLSQALPTYTPKVAYSVGQLVTHADHTWEALHDFTATSTEPDSENWERLPLSQYVSQQDQQPRQKFSQAVDAAATNSLESMALCSEDVRDAWGLIKIVLDPKSVTSDFALVQPENGQALIQPKTYIIRFKNRSTHWRYRYERPHGFTQDKLPDFELVDNRTYFTKRPRSLLARPTDTDLFRADGNLLPAPDVWLIKPESRVDSETKKETLTLFSDVYL